MSMWLQNKYINLMSNQFSVFKRKNNKLYNVRCPECGDSKKNKFKARGYFYLAKTNGTINVITVAMELACLTL